MEDYNSSVEEKNTDNKQNGYTILGIISIIATFGCIGTIVLGILLK